MKAREADSHAVFERMQTILDSLKREAHPDTGALALYGAFVRRAEDKFSAFFRAMQPPEEGIAFERMHNYLLGRMWEEHSAAAQDPSRKMELLEAAIHYYALAELSSQVKRCRGEHGKLVKAKQPRLSVVSFGSDGIISIN
jgi:hypothetical protein